jgi:hypothetical protein
MSMYVRISVSGEEISQNGSIELFMHFRNIYHESAASTDCDKYNQ